MKSKVSCEDIRVTTHKEISTMSQAQVSLGQGFSLTSIPGKVMEQLVLGAISMQLEEKKVIRNSQYGFTKGKSCLIHLVGFYDVMVGKGR